jgi:hypothetical protein
MLAGAVASYVWEHGAARGEALPGGVRSVLTTAKKLPVALRRRGAALYWIAAVAPATSQTRAGVGAPAARAANCGGDGPWGGETSPRRGRPNPRRRTSRPLAAPPPRRGDYYVRRSYSGPERIGLGWIRARRRP